MSYIKRIHNCFHSHAYGMWVGIVDKRINSINALILFWSQPRISGTMERITSSEVEHIVFKITTFLVQQ